MKGQSLGQENRFNKERCMFMLLYVPWGPGGIFNSPFMHHTLSCSAGITPHRNFITLLSTLCCLILRQLRPQKIYRQITKAEKGFQLLYHKKINKSLCNNILANYCNSLHELTFLRSTLNFFQFLPEMIWHKLTPPQNNKPKKTTKATPTKQKLKPKSPTNQQTNQ